MRKFIIVALVLVIVGVGISLTLIPSKNEVAVLQARDSQAVALGNVDVEAEYNQGRRTFPIVSGYADKKVAAGDRPGAIAVLEEYVAANATDAQGRKKLAEQYQLAGDNAKYNAQLEAIANAEPTEANLRVLSDVYNADKNYPKQEEVLKKILEVTKSEKPEVFVDLATIQVVNGKQDDALKTIADLKAKHPTFESYSVVRIQTNILAEQGKPDEAFAIAKAWIDRPIPAATNTQPVTPQATPPSGDIASPANPASQRARELADLCNILHYSGHPDKAVALVEPHVAMLDQSVELVVAYVNANITIGREDYAYDLLAKIDAEGRMTPELYHPYLQLAIKREDSATAQAIATKLDITKFSEEQALNIIELARSMSAKPVLDILLTRFEEPTYLEQKPVLTAVIAILKNTKDQDAKVELALNAELNSIQRLRLAEACVRSGKNQCFETIVSRFPPVEGQTTPQIVEYAQLYIIADRAKEVIEPVGIRAGVADAHPDVVYAHVKLAAAAGRNDVTKPWLEQNANRAPIQKLHELFYTASDHNQNAIASDIAERLYARDPSPSNREIMIAALLKSGEYAKALPLLREQIGENGSNDALYLATLNKVARKDATARKELADYAQAALQSGRGDDRAQINYAYILLNNGRRDAVMPTIAENAKSKGGEWKKMYAQLTARGGKGAPAVKLTREQRIAIAASPKATVATKREMAFGLLNSGHKADATKIFEQLAADKGPDSQEVKDLMYMWGGKLNTQQIAWLQARSKAATPYDKPRWGQLINTYGDDQSVMQYVSTTPDALYNADLRKKYFRIVAGSGNRDNYDARMREWVGQTTDVPALLDYAEIAKGYGYNDAATTAYRRVEQLEPTNAKALAALSADAFARGSYTSAESYVNRSLSSGTNENPAQTHFYKAELLKRQGDKNGALQEYSQVVQLTNPANAAPDGLSRLYTAQFHLGQHNEAKQGFEQLLAQRPDDKGVLADYMSALIEYKYFDDATRIANQYDKSSPYYGRTSAINGNATQVSGVQRFSEGREMKIAFAGPIENNPPVDIAQVKKLGWVEHAELGYDSLSISAKPGTVVRFVPTSAEQFAVVPAPQQLAMAEQQRQQDLRLQLLYARIEQETGQTDRAQQRLAALQQYYPQDPQLISYNASLEAAQGNTGEAIAMYQTAQQLSPDNEDYNRMIRDLRSGGGGSYGGAKTIAQYLKIDHEYRNYGANHEHITTYSGVARVGDRTELGFNLMNDRVNPKGFQDPATGLVTRQSQDFQAGELFLGYYLDNGNRIQGSLFANEDTPGAGLYYAFNNALGRSEVLGEYHKPYWDFPEAVYGLATRDRVGVKHFGMINPTLSYGVETSLNNYNVEKLDNAAQTGLIRFNLEQQLQAKTDSQPYFGVSYGFDGEYLMGDPDTRRINNVGPGSYKPFPFKSRENHQIAGIYRDDWTDSTHVMALGGYLYDRLGENGPVVEGRINQDLSDQMQVGVRGRYGLAASANGTTTEDDAVNLGAHLLYKF